MQLTADILKLLEEGDEEAKTNKIKAFFNLRFERNARIVLNIIHHDPAKWLEKIGKEIKKMEMKKIKEYKRLQKKAESFNPFNQEGEQSKLGRLNAEINELKKLLN